MNVQRVSHQFLLPSVSVFLLGALWWWATASDAASVWPTPVDVARAFLSEWQSQRLWADWWASMSRILLGAGLAMVLGIGLGTLCWANATMRSALRPLVDFLRFVSPISWIPLAILWFGIGDLPVVFLIFVSVIFPMTIATMSALENMPQLLPRVAQDFRLSRSSTMLEVILPAVWPDLLTAMRVMLGMAWVVMVAAEMIAGKQGLGFGIHDARNGMRIDLVILYMLLIGATGWCMDRGLRWMQSRPRWRWKNG
ncbi:MAG TPA: ABC transporter permease [Pseudobdellovibrionaceae bacterium]|nr:ABC transporter permease [Pseudobdellovibrionaceae bacterium]